jgi:hypothetical protein
MADRVKVRREVAGRRGKAVTTISNVPVGDAALRKLAGRLKKRCGVGGSAKNGVIELRATIVTSYLRCCARTATTPCSRAADGRGGRPAEWCR